MRFKRTSEYLNWSENIWTPILEESYVTFDIPGSKFVYGTYEEVRDLVGDSYELLEDALLDTDHTKYLLRIEPSISHSLHDTFAIALKIHSVDPEGVVVLFKRQSNLTPDIYKYFEEFMLHKGIKYVMIDPVDNNNKRLYTPMIKISNYIDIEDYAERNDIELSLDDHLTVSNEIRLHAGVTDIEPYRKVYLSRSHMIKNISVSSNSPSNRDGYTDDLRINNQQILEDFFSSRGYEIVIPEEKFKTFRDQIEYMASVKVLASITSSGLTNSLLMKDKQIVIEISAELVHSRAENVYHQYAVHGFVEDSYIKNHLHISIPSRRSPEEVLAKLKSWDSVVNL